MVKKTYRPSVPHHGDRPACLDLGLDGARRQVGVADAASDVPGGGIRDEALKGGFLRRWTTLSETRWAYTIRLGSTHDAQGLRRCVGVRLHVPARDDLPVDLDEWHVAVRGGVACER